MIQIHYIEITEPYSVVEHYYNLQNPFQMKCNKISKAYIISIYILEVSHHNSQDTMYTDVSIR